MNGPSATESPVSPTASPDQRPAPFVHPSARVHPSAFVAAGARIGANTHVGPCALIEDEVVIGENCDIHAFAAIKQYTVMGRGNVIHSYALVGGVPQDLKFAGEVSRLEMGDNNTVREFSSLHRGTSGGGGVTRIGSGNLLMAYTHVAHDCHLYDNIVLSNGATLGGHVTVFDGAIMGGLSAVHQFARIGRYAFVGGMTGISQDLPPYMLAVGGRAGIHGPNLVGLRRKGLPSATITAIRSAFRTIWLSGLPRSEALEKAEKEFAGIEEVTEILNFLRSSTRGVLPVARAGEGESR